MGSAVGVPTEEEMEGFRAVKKVQSYVRFVDDLLVHLLSENEIVSYSERLIYKFIAFV